MRIAVLAYNLIASGGLSVGRNVTALLPKLAPHHEYLILVPPNLDYEKHQNCDNVTVQTIPRMTIPARLYFDKFTLPAIVKSFNADLVLALGNIGLVNCPCKQVILFHQSQVIYPIKHSGKPIFKDRLRLWAVKRRIKKCLKTANLVFCQTPVVRKRFAEVMDYPIDKIKLMPNAVSEYAKQSDSPPKPIALRSDDRTFNLFLLAGYMPHKNIEILIELFTCYPQELADVRCIITITEEQNKKARALINNIKKYKLEHKIINVGLLKQNELAGYFCHSDALFFPTLLESFSGTYLEAMHFGLPILTSDLDFAHYVCNDAALYFNPWDSRDAVGKILQMKDNAELRQGLIEKGHKRLSIFFKSWENVVKDMIHEIERL